MKIAPLPSNEEERLTALAEYKILDTASEKIFDMITSIAAEVCGVPMCFITILDRERQWFKSNKGLENVEETPRDISFCSHAILDSKIMEVVDAEKDDRFFDNPLVSGEPHIRFYAGMPLMNQEGFKLGTLCVLDNVPKQLSDKQKKILQFLSNIVISYFEVKKTLLQDIEFRKKATIALSEVNLKLENKLTEEQESHENLMALSEMSGMLQTCINMTEAYSVINNFCVRLFPDTTGGLFVTHASRTYVECHVSWGDPADFEDFFVPNECWALRRGQIHTVTHPKKDLLCDHIKAHGTISPYMCLPLIVQTDTTALLCIRFTGKDANMNEGNITQTQQLLASAMAEQIGLALANIKLRETLHQQSIKDPLTGLYNRRYLTDFFNRELPKAMKNHTECALILIDIDYFKKFNDTYGHDLGDTVLCNVADLLAQNTNSDDLVVRYGGEEFLIFMRNATLADADKKANQLQETVRKLQVNHNGKLLNNIRFSQGIALFPRDATSRDDLIVAADKALYRAKESGRDKYIIFEGV